MVKFVWDLDELLIQAVKVRRTLYDPSDENFRNYCLRYKYWEEISEIVGVPVADCKNRYRSLRDQYSKKKKTGQTWENIQGRDYMELMSFLSECSERVECALSVNESRGINNSYNNNRQQVYKLECVEDSSDEETYQRHRESPDQAQDDSSKSGEVSSIRNKRHASEVSLQEPMSKVMATDAQRPVTYEKMSNTIQASKTPIHKFFESMADVVENLPPCLQAEIRLKVCQIVTESELKHYMQDQLQ